MRSTTFLRLGCTALAAALLAACGSDDTSSSSSDGGGGSTAGATECGEEQSGGSASLLQYTEPRTLDPAIISNQGPTNTLVGNALYGQLITTTPDGEVSYGLAESLETTDGGTTWQLTLRQGLTFSNGTPFDAAAVQFNWERMADPATGSPNQQIAQLIDTMSASGLTLDFTLTRPLGGFASSVADSLNWIAEPSALQAGPQAFDEAPIGAGPFVLDSWQRSGPMKLVRNDGYYDAPRPYLDELVLLANADGGQRISTVASGGATGTLNGDATLDRQAADQGLEVTPLPTSDALFYRFNTNFAPFDDVRARQAVVLSVDMTVLNEVVYPGADNVPTTVFSEGSDWNGDTTLPTVDREAAQELFDELAAEGKPVEFTITSFPTVENRRSAESIQAQLSQFDNVQVEVEILDFPAALAKMADGSFDTIVGSLPSSTVQLFNMLHSTGPGNVTGIDDPELDAALEAGTTATDAAARTEAYQTVAARFVDEAYGMIYTRAVRSVVHDDSLQGLEFYGTSAVRTDTLCVAGG